MTDEPQLPPDLPPAPPVEPAPVPEPPREAFWSYVDLLVFAGAALPMLLLGFGVVRAVFWVFRWKADGALFILPAQTLGYVLLFGVLAVMFRMYGRPFWRSMGWVTPGLPAGLIAGAGIATAIIVMVLGAAIRTPQSENEITKLMKDPL